MNGQNKEMIIIAKHDSNALVQNTEKCRLRDGNELNEFLHNFCCDCHCLTPGC